MRTMRPVHDEDCAVACTADIIGSKWTAIVVHDLSEGPRRFSELERSLPGISPRTLSERLRALEQERIVLRRSYPESPPRVEYELTEKGAALLPIIEAMRKFGHAWLVPEHEHPPVPAREPAGAKRDDERRSPRYTSSAKASSVSRAAATPSGR
jgi:DNA-binding HxlR family transcriptional regulator